MHIGPYHIENPLALAPMVGVTDRFFRQLCRSLGAGDVSTIEPLVGRDARGDRRQLDSDLIWVMAPLAGVLFLVKTPSTHGNRGGGVLMKIETLLEMKGRDVVTVHPTAKLSAVVRRMKLGHTGCVVVSEDGTDVQGIIAVRDISYLLAEHDDANFAMDRPASEIMTRSVKTYRGSSPKGRRTSSR